MKYYPLSLFSFLLIFSSCTVSSNPNINNEDGRPQMNEIHNDYSSYESILHDPNFAYGIKVIHRKYSKNYGENLTKRLDYNGSALGSSSYWTMSQWGRAEQYSLYYASTSSTSSPYTYGNEARAIDVDVDNGEITLHHDSGKEFIADYGVAKNSRDSNIWPHMLLESSLKSVKMGDIDNLYVSFDYTPIYCQFDGVELSDQEKAGADGAAQLFMYFRLQENDTTRRCKIWLGLPLFDSRYNVIQEYHNLDANHAGATNDTIYSASTRDYLPVNEKYGIEMNKTYHIEFDLLTHARNAFEYASSFDAETYPKASFAGCDFDNVTMFYMNFGYEMPGAFNMTHRISSLNVYAHYKDNI